MGVIRVGCMGREEKERRLGFEFGFPYVTACHAAERYTCHPLSHAHPFQISLIPLILNSLRLPNRFPNQRRHLSQTVVYAFTRWLSCGSTSVVASSNNNVNSKRWANYGPLSYHHKPAQTPIFLEKSERLFMKEQVRESDPRIFHWEGRERGEDADSILDLHTPLVTVSLCIVFLDSALSDRAFHLE